MSKIDIELDKADFTGGDEVTGRVVLSLDEPVPARGIRAHFEGYERAHWVRGYGKNGSPSWETRTFFDEEQTLHGQPPLSSTAVIKDAIRGLFSRDEYEILEVGTHTYPFSFRLPEDLPGDYESPKASTIRYEITAYVDIPLRIDLRTSRRLTIYESYDRDKVLPVHAEASKSFLLHDDAQLDVSLRLDRNMFHPGDPVRVVAEVRNGSPKRLERLRLILVQIEDLRAQERSTQDRFEMPLAEVEAPHQEKNEAREVIITGTIPDDLYASIASSELVRLSYALLLRVDVAWGADLSVELPIVLLEEAGMPSGVKLSKATAR